MHLRIVTLVKSPLQRVKEGFNEELFLALNPPFPPVRVLEFGGCDQGDRVSLELNFIFFKQKWVSLITEDHFGENEWYFIDQGIQLPFFLKTWSHKHIVRGKSRVEIIDDINYTTGSLITDLFLSPLLFLQFLYRKPIYRRKFST